MSCLLNKEWHTKKSNSNHEKKYIFVPNKKTGVTQIRNQKLNTKS
jgi:hypothetical protein